MRLANEWIVTAADDLSARSRRDKPLSIKVEIGNWRGEITSGGSADEAARGFTNFIDREVHDQLGQVNIVRQARTFAASVSLLIVSVLAVTFRWLPVVPLLVIGGCSLLFLGGTFIWLGRSRRVLPARRQAVREDGEARKQAGLASLRQAAGETKRVFQLWEAELAKESSLVDFVREQASQTDPLKAPAIEVRDRVSDPPEAPGSKAELPGNLARIARIAERPPGADQSFAFKLPDWDLLPPQSSITRRTFI